MSKSEMGDININVQMCTLYSRMHVVCLNGKCVTDVPENAAASRDIVWQIGNFYVCVHSCRAPVKIALFPSVRIEKLGNR